MIGDSYFDLRARLGAALYSLSEIAEEAGVTPGRAVLLRQMVSSLKDPFLFVVAGEVNAGKSTFLNALFGEPFCEADVLPTTERIYYFKHGEHERDVSIDDSFVEMYRTNPFLRDFHIVDTPGTNSVAEGHQEITERFIPMADLVIFVFSVTNPWGASTWDFIEQIYEGWLKNVVFVMQQSDLRSPEEVNAISEHMKVTARGRLGREFPVFPVSGKQAFLAKSSPHAHEGMLEKSGFPALEEYISKMVVSTGGMQQKFQNAIHTARVIMREVEAKLGDKRSILDNDRRILASLDGEITTQYKQTSHALEGQSAEVLSEFDKSKRRAYGRLSRGMGILSCIFGRSNLVDTVEEKFSDEVGEAGRMASSQSMLHIEKDLPPLWHRLEANIQKEYRVSLSIEDESGRPKWLVAREGFGEELESRCRGALLDSESVDRMDAIVRERRFAVRTCGFGILMAVMLTGFGFLFEVKPLYYVAASLAAMGFFGLLVMAGRKQKALQDVFDDRVSRAEQNLAREVKTAFGVQMGKYYKEFLGIFEMVRGFCEGQQTQYQPLFDDMTNLENTFSDLERDMEYHRRRAEAI
jgi:GTPase SAR1 family protein